ncbi:MAG: hypothetical protein JW757_13820 [Anaerolineales bacterium]|nr:hypothetical protein [Anaerolineales bacterium]
MSDKTPAKPTRGFQRALVFIVLALIWLLMLAAVVPPGAQNQASFPSSVLRGGQLYVAWDQVTRTNTSTLQQSPLWPVDTPNQVPPIFTLRCVNCHGWDYRGSNGKTLGAIFRAQGYPGLLKYTFQPVETILPILDGRFDPAHDFSAYLSEEDLQDLAEFISKGLVIPDLVADPETYEVQGTPERGREPYIEFCSACHGFEGERINLATEQNPAYLGDVAWNNPWLMTHIIRFGHISAQVPAASQLGISFSQQLDIAAFTQTLPDADFITGPDYEDIDLSAQANTGNLVYGAVAITALVYLATIITLWREKKQH